MLLGGDNSAMLLGGDNSAMLFGGDNSAMLPGGDNSTMLPGGYNNAMLPGGYNNEMLLGGDNNAMLLGGDNNSMLLGGYNRGYNRGYNSARCKIPKARLGFALFFHKVNPLLEKVEQNIVWRAAMSNNLFLFWKTNREKPPGEPLELCTLHIIVSPR